MASLHTHIRRLTAVFACCAAFLAAWGSTAATAGTINFELELRDSRYVAVNRGDSAAYYPALFRLDRSGRWQELQPDVRPMELWHGGVLSAPAAATPAQGVEQAEVLLVRFFDQAGIAFSQITVLSRPPAVAAGLKASYAGTRLTINAPHATDIIKATWLLLPWDTGIASLLTPQSFAHTPARAVRMHWREQSRGEFVTGTHLPDLLLLHETSEGFRLQRLTNSNPRHPEQRTAWLRMKRTWYLLAGFCGLGGALLALQAYRSRVAP